MNVKEELKKYIAREFIVDEEWHNIPDDYDLIKNGILDSMAIINLIVFLEEKYKIEIPEEEIDSQSFTTIKMINYYLSKKGAIIE